ncbi:hypothetical protein H310_00185 [Aphanomyces invadans]|uniref:Nuclear speckle splicing regulatory protein 1 N-terminal domain-containing protein n=1 Tax=Aphanomyces invadans TaxID=157072 RepID=A0A024UUN6_9STRA|nr:hypothetical protein H310_00185 [Aphanomyces invadans]ETW09670.1 hypothetical protein H310_00185 [Aphanomyces invadans]RHY33594.1 hypothetical protein DYB32_001523 [Aphanomyces invadans]|eukprot:XP_008861081.1 hypothetical protein H310_00185 [Aphanomyces invadans]
MAFSMKLKSGKKSSVPPVSAATQRSSSVFSIDEPPPVVTKGPSSLPPPPLLSQPRPGVYSKSERVAHEALADDPNVFDYDGAYDSIQAERQKLKEAKKVHGAPQSKYIGALMEKAKIREVEHDRIRERRLLKEREEDDALHGDKEKFITASYKRKLMESKRWEQEDARLAAIEAANDVTKREHGMAGFYANLLTNNIAMGGDVSKATSAYTTGKLSMKRSDSLDATIPPSPKKLKGEDKPKEVMKEVSSPKSAPAATIQRVNRDDHTNEASTKELPVPSPAPTQSREDVIRAAKERYLARKQAMQSS